MKNNITIEVCFSCLRDNEQSDPLLQDPKQLMAHYEKQLKGRLWGKQAKFRFVDCLTNCDSGNSVQINRKDGGILFSKINSTDLTNEVISLALHLRKKNPLQESSALKEHLARIMPIQDGRTNYSSE